LQIKINYVKILYSYCSILKIFISCWDRDTARRRKKIYFFDRFVKSN